MKKRDRPLVGDSPARIRVPMVGTVSLGGVVAVANGRCGIPESSPGQAPSCIGAQIPPPGGVGEKTCATCVGLGEEGWKPAGGAGGGGSDPRAGRCLVERSARASSRKKATARGPSRALKRPVASRVVNRCLRYDSAEPLSGQGRGQAFARGRRPRRLRPETSLPGFQRIPRTAATSSVPPSSVGTKAAALPVPWL